MLTDTHCHLADPQLFNQLDAVLSRSQAAGVRNWIVPATSPNDWQTVVALSSDHRNIQMAIGVHPWFAEHLPSNWLDMLHQLLTQYPHAWLGEIGLDRRHTPPSLSQQLDIFTTQVTLAQQHQRPIIVHNVGTTEVICRVLRENRFTQGGIAHAFSGSLEEAKQLIDCGLLIGIGSLLFNPNAKKVRIAATQLPAEHIVFETDSPFMLPNHINEPAYTARIAAIVAELRQTTLAELAAQTERNLHTLYTNQQ